MNISLPPAPWRVPSTLPGAPPPNVGNSSHAALLAAVQPTPPDPLLSAALHSAAASLSPGVALLAVALTALSPPMALAASPVGLMTVSGPVRIGGSEFQPKAVSSWPVLNGDEIVTEDRSRAVLVSPTAGRLEIGHDSRVTARQNTVVLHSGEVGAERFVVRTGRYTATPQPDASGHSWFVVSSRDGVPVFAAQQGDLWVSQGEPNQLLVRAGTYAMPAPEPEPALPPEPAASPAGSAAGGAAQGGLLQRGPMRTSPGQGNPVPGGPLQGGQVPNSPLPAQLAPANPPQGNPGAGPQYGLRPDESATLPGTPAASTSATTAWTVGSLSHASSVALVSGLGAAATVGTIAGVALVEPKLHDRSPSSEP